MSDLQTLSEAEMNHVSGGLTLSDIAGAAGGYVGAELGGAFGGAIGSIVGIGASDLLSTDYSGLPGGVAV